MQIIEIINNGLDLAGGELIRQKLDTNFATLVCLNVIDTMMLELSNSKKAIHGYKTSMTLAANVATGNVGGLEDYTLGERYVRYRQTPNDRWQILDVVDKIEDLTAAENRGRQAILFVGIGEDAKYYLSWTPTQSINAELWGKILTGEIGNLNALPPIPPEFSLLAAYRVADFTLNQLLIIDAKGYRDFVIAQKASLSRERDRCEHIWRVYREITSDTSAASRINEYVLSEDNDEFEEDFSLDSLYPG